MTAELVHYIQTVKPKLDEVLDQVGNCLLSATVPEPTSQVDLPVIPPSNPQQKVKWAMELVAAYAGFNCSVTLSVPKRGMPRRKPGT